MQKGMFRMFKITKKVDFWTKFSNEYQCNFLEKWTLKYQKNILGFLVLNQFLISAILRLIQLPGNLKFVLLEDSKGTIGKK